MDLKIIRDEKAKVESGIVELVKNFYKATGLMPDDILFESKIVSRPDAHRIKRAIEYRNRVELVVKL